MNEDNDDRRIVYIENLRIFLTALVICHHQAVAFGAPGGWYYVARESTDIVSTIALVVFVAVNQAFFMSLFFFVAAYFTPISLESKGARRFIRDRLIRLGIPLLVFFFLLNPTVMYMTLYFRDTVKSNYPVFMRNEALRYTGWGPLWFVLSLLIFTSAYLVVVNSMRRKGKIVWPNNKQIFAFVIGIGVITFLLRIVNKATCPVGEDMCPRRSPFDIT